MRSRPDTMALMTAVLLALALTAPAAAGDMLDVGDEAPPFMLYSYNETETKAVSGSTTPGIGQFLGISPEHPKKVVLLVFLDKNSAADLETLSKLQRKYGQKGAGLQVVVVGVAREAVEMNDAIGTAKGGVEYPVLRDRFLVVSGRYGVERDAAPAIFLLAGEAPDVELTAKEQHALDNVAHRTHLSWVVRIRGRWTGSVTSQEEAIARSVEAYVGK
jgi:hypothetical protein